MNGGGNTLYQHVLSYRESSAMVIAKHFAEFATYQSVASATGLSEPSFDPLSTPSAECALTSLLEALTWAQIAALLAEESCGWLVLEPSDVSCRSRELSERQLDHDGRETQPEPVARFSGPLEGARWVRGYLAMAAR